MVQEWTDGGKTAPRFAADTDSRITTGGFPERSKGSDCKSDGNAFTGSNPVPPIGQMTKDEIQMTSDG